MSVTDYTAVIFRLQFTLHVRCWQNGPPIFVYGVLLSNVLCITDTLIHSHVFSLPITSPPSSRNSKGLMRIDCRHKSHSEVLVNHIRNTQSSPKLPMTSQLEQRKYLNSTVKHPEFDNFLFFQYKVIILIYHRKPTPHLWHDLCWHKINSDL